MTTASTTTKVPVASTGADVAVHSVAGKLHQAMVLVDADGHVKGSLPVYSLIVPSQAVGANKVFFDLFNATGSGVSLRLLSVQAIPNNTAAVTGTLGAELVLTRTSAVGTGGTAAVADSATLTDASLSKANPASASLPAGVTARLAPAGGATAGAALGRRYVFTEETNSATAMAGIYGAEFVIDRERGIVVPADTGIRVVQGAVASVGNLSFHVTFEVFA